MLSKSRCQYCGERFRRPDGHGGQKYCHYTKDCRRLANLARHRELRKSWSDDRRKAYPIVTRAMRDGLLVKQPCGQCGRKRNIHAHHDDYSRPLDVRWLCAGCHRQHHVDALAHSITSESAR